jgi:CRP/FNR family transcriptional regulator
MGLKQDWSPLAEGRIPKAYEAGQLIYLQGEEPKALYYLTEGTARSFISSPEGAERLLTVHHSGDLMGEASFFDQCPRVSSAVTVTSCQVISVDRDQLDRVFQAHPDLAFPMLRYLARTVRLLSGHVDDISFRPADKRLASALLDLAGPDGQTDCTHEELGSMVGVSRVTVSRVLSQFAARGWLRQGYRTLWILDRAALEKYAQNE